MQKKWLVAGLGVMAVATACTAADRTWTGASAVDNNWSRPENWAGAVAPVAGDALIFGGKMMRAGTYGASGSAAIYKDSTHFSGSGMLTVLHDNAGTLFSLR